MHPDHPGLMFSSPSAFDHHDKKGHKPNPADDGLIPREQHGIIVWGWPAPDVPIDYGSQS